VTYVRAKAPLRISFGGGGTDVPPYPAEEGGCVLSAAINRFAWGTLRPRSDTWISIESRDIGTSLLFSSLDHVVLDGEMDLVKAAIRKLAGDSETGYDLYLHADSPPGSGLGSSSALVVGLVGLFKEWQGRPLTDHEVAELAYEIERVDLGIAGGLQDQYSAAFGGFNFMEFYEDRVVVNSLRLSSDLLNELEYNLLLVDMHRPRASSHIISDQVDRYERREPASIDALRNIKRVANDMKDRLLGRRLDEFGELLHEDWEQKKRMSSRITNAEIDELYALARSNGALGGKITGAGGGGHMLLYCGFGKKHVVAEALRKAGCEPISFALEPRGLQTWRAG
jgi:D-glycero-alpha-D-manno-heptose-7-phosphate kinase